MLFRHTKAAAALNGPHTPSKRHTNNHSTTTNSNNSSSNNNTPNNHRHASRENYVPHRSSSDVGLKPKKAKGSRKGAKVDPELAVQELSDKQVCTPPKSDIWCLFQTCMYVCACVGVFACA